jgi:hypothetical protein
MKAAWLALLALLLLVSGCGLSARHIAAEGALAASDIADEASVTIRQECVLPYSNALSAGDQKTMVELDTRCDPIIASYDFVRASIAATKLALKLDDTAELQRLGIELVASAKRLFEQLSRMGAK